MVFQDAPLLQVDFSLYVALLAYEVKTWKTARMDKCPRIGYGQRTMLTNANPMWRQHETYADLQYYPL